VWLKLFLKRMYTFTRYLIKELLRTVGCLAGEDVDNGGFVICQQNIFISDYIADCKMRLLF